MPDRETLLRIYVNDHLAATTAGIAVARRTLRSNPDGELGRFLAGLVDELEEDRAALERVLHALGGRGNPAKQGAAWLAPRLGLLKLNGRVRGYSDLSRLLELEGLRLGAEATAGLWRSLRASGRSLPVDLDGLIERAERRREQLEVHHLAAARLALGDASATPSGAPGGTSPPRTPPPSAGR